MTSAFTVELLDDAMSIIGTTGAGKSYVAKGAVEQILDLKHRVCILDPTGVWYGLKTSADGASPAYPVVIFGGEHADVPLDPTATTGEALGRVIASGSVPASIIDTSEMTGGETTRLMTTFFEELLAKNKHALHLVLDEADAFAPQFPDPGQERMKGAVSKIARRGRRKGFRLLTITQRPALLDKNVMSMIRTLVAMALTSPQDRSALQGWIKGNADEDEAKAVLASLPRLARGEGWIWSPTNRVLERTAFPSIRTLDTSRTPEHGETPIEARAAAKVDVAGLRQMFISSTSNEGEKANPADRAALKAIGETAAKLDEKIAEAERRGYERGFIEGRASFSKALREQLEASFAGLQEGLAAIGRDFASRLTDAMQLSRPSSPSRARENSIAPVEREPVSAAIKAQDGTVIGPAAEKLLAALARYPDGLATWQEVCIVAGMLHGNGYFYGGRKALLSQDLAEQDQNGVRATIGGFARAGGPGEPLTLEEIVALWAPKLRPPGNQMLGHIARVGIATVADMAEATGIKPGNGYWYGGIAAIRDTGLVDTDKVLVRLSPLLAAAEPIRKRAS